MSRRHVVLNEAEVIGANAALRAMRLAHEAAERAAEEARAASHDYMRLLGACLTTHGERPPDGAQVGIEVDGAGNFTGRAYWDPPAPAPVAQAPEVSDG